jgi:hypothetical protein
VAPSAPKDTVQISTAAQTALQESKESQAQTAKEAAHGDRQAAKIAREGDYQEVIATDVATTGDSHATGDTLDGVKGFQCFTSHPAISPSFSNLQSSRVHGGREFNVRKRLTSSSWDLNSRESTILASTSFIYFW